MGLTDITFILGQKVDKSDLLPEPDEGSDDVEDIDDGWGIWPIEKDGRVGVLNEASGPDPVTQATITNLSECVTQVFVIDQAPYEGALANEVILGVYAIDSGTACMFDGYGDITDWLRKIAPVLDVRIEEITRLLRERGLPHDQVRLWVVATPDT